MRIQLAMKSCAKENTYSVGVAGPTTRNASARSSVTVRTPRPQLCTRRLHSYLLSNGLAAAAALGPFPCVVWGAFEPPSALSTLVAGKYWALKRRLTMSSITFVRLQRFCA